MLSFFFQLFRLGSGILLCSIASLQTVKRLHMTFFSRKLPP